jgi:hypothetical protein
MATPSPEEIGDALVYASDVHETQLCELRKDSGKLLKLAKAAVGKPIAGYARVPNDHCERNRFFAAMKALCESKSTTAVGLVERRWRRQISILAPAPHFLSHICPQPQPAPLLYPRL